MRAVGTGENGLIEGFKPGSAWFDLSTNAVDVVRDLEQIFKAKGVEFTREPTTVRPGTRVCFIRGPQGVSIELLDRTV